MRKTEARSSFPDPAHDHGPCLDEAVARAESAFEASGLRLTPLRRTVLEEIAASHAAIGAYDILERLARKSGRRLAPISIYRALDSLVDAGLVHRLESRNAFFACHTVHAADRRQIVLACRTCSVIAEVTEAAVFDGIARAAERSGFVPDQTLVEVTGFCSKCGEAKS